MTVLVLDIARFLCVRHEGVSVPQTASLIEMKSRGIPIAVVIVTVRYFRETSCFFSPPPLATEEQ